MDIANLRLLEDEEIELDLAALALSKLDHEGADLAPYVALIQEIAERLATVGARAETPQEQASALATVFAEEFGFTGDVETYDAPLNADMIRVLDRRRGLPVSLAILYVSAARRVRWTAHALNTPGHVLASVGSQPAILIDPFNGGKTVTSQQLLALLARTLGTGVGVDADHVAPMANRNVLVRLLLNQASRAEQEGDVPRATILYERMTQIAPQNGHGWWELARLQLVARNVESARRSLSAMLEVTRERERRDHIAAALDAIAPR